MQDRQRAAQSERDPLQTPRQARTATSGTQAAQTEGR
jgi:hypothetical protein